MTTKQMEYIVELKKTRNFNRAAENLFITQPALSYQIQKAEEEIGFALFVRSGRGASMTIAGERFADTIEQLLSSYEEALSEGQRLDPLYSAAITISIPAKYAIRGMRQAVGEFSRERPQTPIHFRDYGSARADMMEGLDSDIVFVVKGSNLFSKKGWKKVSVCEGYRQLDAPADIEPRDDGQTLWVPFEGAPKKLEMLIKNDSDRPEVSDFITCFQRVS